MGLEQYIGDISGYENYLIRYDGSVIKLMKGEQYKEMSPRINSAGDLTVQLSKNGKRVTHHVRQLVAQAFMTDYDPELEVVCLSGERDWCHIENLWQAPHLVARAHHDTVTKLSGDAGMSLSIQHMINTGEKDWLLSEQFTTQVGYKQFVLSQASLHGGYTRLQAEALAEGHTWTAGTPITRKVEKQVADIRSGYMLSD